MPRTCAVLPGAVGFLVVLATSLYLSGCQEKSTEPIIAPEPIQEDLFQLIVGRKLTFSGYLRDKITDANIESTGAIYEARMTVTGVNIQTPYGTGHVLSDSQRVPSGLANPPSVWLVDQLYLQRSAPTGTDNISLLTNIGRFFRTFGIQRSDSLRWILLAKLDAGVGVDWVGLDDSWSTTSGQLRLQIVARFDAKAPVTVGGQTFSAYRVTVIRKIYLGGSSTPLLSAETSSVWLAPGIGIVKFILNSDGETSGFYRELKSKNF